MNVLALDIAFVTGFAAGRVPASSPTVLEAAASPSEKPFSGEVRVVPKGSTIAVALDRYERWLNEMISVHQPDLLIFEAPLYTPSTAFDTARKLIGMAGLTEMVALRHKIKQVWEGNNQKVKKHFAGHGHADKAAMEYACKERGWIIEEGNHNEADALALFDFTCACLAGRA